jgi:cell pole-organizing protein PopZ
MSAGEEPSRRKSLAQSAPVARNTETREYARPQTCPTVAPTSGSTYPIRSAFEPHSRYYFELSLEDLLRELLHPLLKQWLDLNLPCIVERLVNEEIERMVER